MQFQYGLDWDRDFLMDIAFGINSVLPIISSLTIYPANFYLLIYNGPAMNWEIRAAYLVNIGMLTSATMSVICTFYVLMMRMHQLTVVHNSNSRWKLSQTTQLIIYTSVCLLCMMNVIGFVVLGTDVENNDELVMTPELSWMDRKGGTLLLFGEPGKHSQLRYETYFLLVAAIIFLPLLSFYMAHALLYFRENERRAFSTATQLLTRRLFATFTWQLIGAVVFFTAPLSFILFTSVVDMSELIPGPVFAALRFTSLMLLELNQPQTGLVFILRNETHRRILLRRFQKLGFVARFRNESRIMTLITGASTETVAIH